MQHVRDLSLAITVAYLPYVLANAWCISGYGMWETGGFLTLLLFPLLIILFPAAMLPKSSMGRMKVILSVCLALLFVPILLLSSSLRIYGFYLAGQRAEPIIKAIDVFEKENGKPPESLAELVPKYIKELPQRIPDLQIATNSKGLPNFPENRWILIAPASTGILNWDQFIYLQAQNYEQSKLHLERIGSWAYYHE